MSRALPGRATLLATPSTAIRAGLTIRAALFLGIGLTIGIWFFAGYYSARRMAGFESDEAAISARYTRAQELLTTARSQVLLASVSVRDALLDPDLSKADDYQHQLDDAYGLAEQSLQQYVPVLDSTSERERIARLRREIDDFKSATTQVLALDPRRSPAEAARLLRQQVMPKRAAATDVADELQTLNRAAFVRTQAEIAAVFLATQRGMWDSLGLALLASVGIGLAAVLYAGRLERRIHQQRVKDTQNAIDLQRLSAKLISIQEEERRTIARELHDEVGQALTAIKVELAIAQRGMAGHGTRSHMLDEARSITDGALQAVRDLSQLLHPPVLDDLGLPAAIESHLKGFRKRHGVRVELFAEPMTQRARPHTEIAAYRIVQEALTNVAKHAQATVCRVSLQQSARSLLVTIDDDGVGFDLAEVERERARRGLGLIGIRERVAQLHGTLRIETAPGRGTCVTVELPALLVVPGAQAAGPECVDGIPASTGEAR